MITVLVSLPTQLSFDVAVHRPRPGRSWFIALAVATAAALDAFLLGPTGIDGAADLIRHPSARA